MALHYTLPAGGKRNCGQARGPVAGLLAATILHRSASATASSRRERVVWSVSLAIPGGKLERVVFVVSSGRTGTTALAQHLERCFSQVRAMHEPSPSWRLRRASAKALCGRMTRDQLVVLLASSRRKLLASIDRPIYVESNPYLGGFIEAFGDVFDAPRIVHVVRDPRTFIRSSMNFGTFRGVKQLAQGLIPYWLPKPEHCAGPCVKRWGDMAEPERLAWYWELINRELNRGQELYGPNYLRVRFEDLFARDGSGLHRLTDWIGLPRNEELAAASNSENVNASGKGRFPKWDEWDAQLKEQVLGHCRKLMVLYGYDLEKQATVPLSAGALGLEAHATR
jgi:hypothetical protein